VQKLWRPWLSSAHPDKQYIIGWSWGLEQSGAVPQIGDPATWAERVSHEEIALIMGCTRETVTKSLGMLYYFGQGCRRCSGANGEHDVKCRCKCHTTHPEWREESLCACHGIPRRDCQSEKLKAIAANHPHWQTHHGDTEARSEKAEREKSKEAPLADQIQANRQDGEATLGNTEDHAKLDSGLAHLPDDEGVRLETLGGSNPTPSNSPPGEGAAVVEASGRRANRKDGERRGREHVAPIFARNAGFACANTYALACDTGKRPGIGAGSNQVGFLAHTFGADLFSRQAQNGWLEPRQSLEGFRKSRPQWFDPKLPDAWDCDCVLGQKKFNFQEVCPKCEGRGFIIGKPTEENGYKGSMPWRGRMILHFLDDRGLDVELRRCNKCDRVFEGNQMCAGCGARGEVHKKRGELNSGSAKYTEYQIGLALGLHESTVSSYFKRFRRIGILRTVKGTAWRKCQRCTNLPLYTDKCPGCGSTSDPIKRRDPQLIIDLTSRTLDKQLAATERTRLENLVKWHRKWLDQKHQAELEAAVEMAKKVLGEWEGREHLLVSFHREMRRRFAASKLRANLVNVLFPLQRE
jgi:DNA-binding CsgD family transcriptional regulator